MAKSKVSQSIEKIDETQEWEYVSNLCQDCLEGILIHEDLENGWIEFCPLCSSTIRTIEYVAEYFILNLFWKVECSECHTIHDVKRLTYKWECPVCFSQNYKQPVKRVWKRVLEKVRGEHRIYDKVKNETK